MCSYRNFVVALLTIGGAVTFGSIFSPYMLLTEHVSEDYHIIHHSGFFEICSEVTQNDEHTTHCIGLVNVNIQAWWKGCQALGSIGAISSIIGWVLLMCWLCLKQKAKSTKSIIVVFIFIGTVGYGGSLLLWFTEVETDEYKDPEHEDSDETVVELGSSFYVGWFGTILIMISGCLLCRHPMTSDTQRNGGANENTGGHMMQQMTRQPQVMVHTSPQYAQTGYQHAQPMPQHMHQAMPQPMPMPMPHPMPMPQPMQPHPPYPPSAGFRPEYTGRYTS